MFEKTKNQLCSHQKNADHFTYTCQSAGIDLNDINRVGLQKLLEDHAIMRMLASGHTNPMGLQGLSDSCMPKDIIRSSGFLNKPTSR